MRNNFRAGIVAFENLSIYIVLCLLCVVNQCFQIELNYVFMYLQDNLQIPVSEQELLAWAH